MSAKRDGTRFKILVPHGLRVNDNAVIRYNRFVVTMVLNFNGMFIWSHAKRAKGTTVVRVSRTTIFQVAEGCELPCSILQERKTTETSVRSCQLRPPCRECGFSVVCHRQTREDLGVLRSVRARTQSFLYPVPIISAYESY